MQFKRVLQHQHGAAFAFGSVIRGCVVAGGKCKLLEVDPLGNELLVGAKVLDLTLTHHCDLIGVACELDLVGDQDASGVAEDPADAVVEEMGPDVGVHRGQRVVKEVNVRPGVDGPCKRHAVLLTARKVDPLGADLRLVSCNKHLAGRRRRSAPGPPCTMAAARSHLEVALEGTGFECPLVHDGVILSPPQNVVSDGHVLDPGVLACVGNFSPHIHITRVLDGLPDERLQEGAFPAPDLSNDDQELAGKKLAKGHTAQYIHHEGREFPADSLATALP